MKTLTCVPCLFESNLSVLRKGHPIHTDSLYGAAWFLWKHWLLYLVLLKIHLFKSGGCVKCVCQISGYYSRSSKRPNQSHISSSQLPLMAMKCALGVIRTIRPSTIPPCHNPIIQFTASLLDAKFGPKRSHDQKWKIKQGHTYGFHLKCSKFENINFCLFGLNKNQDQNCDKADKAFWNLEDMMLSHGCLGEGKMMGGQNEKD